MSESLLKRVIDLSDDTMRMKQTVGAAAVRATIQASTTATTSGQSASSSVGGYKEALVTLDVTAASGTSPTLNVVIQASDDGGTTWFDLPGGTFSQKTAVSNQAIQIATFGDTIRAKWTIVGVSPSFTFAIKAVQK